jgi:hypothetical protein
MFDEHLNILFHLLLPNLFSFKNTSRLSSINQPYNKSVLFSFPHEEKRKEKNKNTSINTHGSIFFKHVKSGTKWQENRVIFSSRLGRHQAEKRGTQTANLINIKTFLNASFAATL